MSIIPPKKKSKFINKSDQERLFQKFYDNLEMKKVIILVMFLRMRTMLILLVRTFQAVTQILMMKLIWNSMTILPSVAAAIGDPTPASKQIFSNLEKVLDLDNYNPCLFKNILSLSIQILQKVFK